jgi:hypothetical protein
MIRIVGTFTPAGSGSSVDYKIEFMPAALIAVAAAFIVSLPVIAIVIELGYVSTGELLWLIVIVPLVAAANLWLSERQARWLKEFVLGRLPTRASPS